MSQKQKTNLSFVQRGINLPGLLFLWLEDKLVVSLYLKIKSIRRNKVALQKSKVVFLLPIFVLITLFAINAVPKSTYAATNSDINFQARLENSSGAIVPDGWYNVEFKLYSASSGGSAEWTEDYTYSNGSSNCTGAPNGTGDCRVQVYNGYLTVSLGSITNFPNTINWDQQQWLTMNIGGTAGSGTITWDGEMSPRLQVTSVPYAFRAGQLAYENGSSQESTLSWYSPSSAYSLYLPNENGTLCVEGSTNCNFAPTTGGTGYIQNQNSSPQSGANFNIGGSGIIGSTLTTPALQSAASTALTITGNAASTWSTSAGNLSIQAAGTNTLSLDTTGAGTVSIANNAATIDVGSNNTSAETINVGGSGSNTINIGNTQTAGSINLGSALTTGYISIGGTGNQTGSISLGTGSGTQSISLGTGSGAKTLTVGSTNSSSTLSLQGGATTEELTNSGETLTSSNSTSAFQVTGGSNNVFSVSTNTTTPQAVLGTNANLAGSLLFNTTSSGDPITLQATSDSTTGGYVLSLPTTAPSAGLCLQTSSSYTASTGQLVFGLCSNANASISEVAYSDNHGYSSVVTTVSDSALTVGDLIVVTVQVPSTSATVTSITGGNASNWNRVAYKAGNGTVHRVEMWMGTVTTTGSSTITVNSSASLGNNDEITETEYTASGVNAGTSWGADTEGTNLSSGSTTVSYPSLEPQSEGELYEGYAQVQNPSATAGSTDGFNYQATGQGNMEVYDPDVNPISIFSPTAYQSSSGQANTVAAIFTAYISSTAINNTTVTQIGNFNVEAQSNGSTGTVAGVLQAAYGDTTDNILNFYNDSAGQSSTNQVLGITETGNLQFGGLTSQSIAVTSQVTGTQLSISAGGATSGVNVGGSLVLQGGVGANSNPSGSVIVQSNSSNSSMAFIVQNASSAKVLNVDTINNAVTVGTATVYGALGLPSSLASSENLTTGSNPFSQTTGNFCGNNRADLAVTNYTTGTISLYCNNGTTLPTTATSTLTTGTEPEGIATGNFCGNNRADLASANSNTNNISIFCNTGTGFSSTASSTLTAGTNPYGLASGNFCDNGRSDLAVTNHGTNTIFVYCNTGSALPTTVTSTLTTSSSPQIIVTANLCDSGYADIAVSSPTSNNVNIFCNTGSALPTTATSTISGGTGATIEGEATGSFCDSAYTDLAVMDYGTASTSIYCNTGSALPTTATSTLTTGNDPETAIGGNFCGNGRADLAIENFVNASVSVFCNTGTALPTTASSTLTTSAYPGNVITGNFCNNGRADLTVSSTTANVVNVFCNVTTGLAVSTANAQGLGEIIQASSNQTANLFQVQNSSGTSLDTIDGSGDLTVSDNSTTTNTGVLTVNATGLTTGYAENINVNAATTLTTGGALNIVGPSNTANLSGGTGLVDIQAAGAFTTSAGVGGLLQVNTATKTGTAVSIVGTGTMTTTGNLLTVTANSATTATGILTVNATGLTTGYAEYINVKSTTALTTGGALQVVGPSGAAGLSSGTGLVDIQETGVITTSTGVGGLLQLSTATVTGTAASIVGTGTMTTTGNLLTVTDNSATTVTGLVTINGSGLTTGSALNINAGTGTALTIDSGSTLNLASATTGNTAILKIPQDTSSTDCSSGTHEGVEIQNNSGTQVGHICINGASATTAPGDLEYYAQAFNASSTDVAENYSDVDNNLAPGDVVALAGDGASSDDIIKGSQDNLSSVIGVVSTSPGILLSGIEDSGGTNLINPEPVALSGRIPTNVTSENGPIEPGDYLTASATMPGYAMKATQAGNVIGQAITGYSGSGTGQVIMFVKATYYAGPSVTQTLQSASLANITASNLITTNSLQVNGLATISSLLTNNANIQTLNVSGTATIQNLTVISGITSQNLTVTGSADVTNLTVDNGISLGSNNEDPTQQNTHPITIRMVANGPISAGSVVVTDPTDGPGYVEQASQNGSTEVIGVAITSSTSKGNIIQIAVGGTADVAVPEGSNVSIGQLLESGATGNAITSSKIGPGQLLGKVLGTINPNNQVLILITL